jgi:hypothetical protein
MAGGRRKGGVMRKVAALFSWMARLCVGAWCIAGAVGCASLKSVPKPAEASDGLLVISMEHESYSGDFPFYYSLSSDDRPDDQTRNPVEPAAQYAFMKGLSPGHHVITRILVRLRKTQQIVQQWQVSVPFDIKEGAITILPIRLTVAWGKDNDTKDKLFFGSHNLTKEDLMGIQQDLGDWENIDLWSFAPVV